MDEIDKATFAKRVKRRLKALHLSQSAAAKLLRVPQSSMNNVCRGLVEQPHFINELADLLATTRVWLLWGQGQEVTTQTGLRERAFENLAAIPPEKLPQALIALERLSASLEAEKRTSEAPKVKHA